MSDLNYNNSGNENNSFMEKIKAYWNSIPLVVKIITTITIIFYLMSWISLLARLVVLFANVPLYTLYKFHIWRVVTSLLVTPSILNILFAFMSWLPKALMMEREVGSTRYFLNTFTRSTLIQIMFTFIIFFFSLLFESSLLKQPSMGLWPLILADITISCIAEPEREVMFFFIPYPIKSKYYPWVLIGFFTLLNFSIQIDILCGVLFGYIYHWKLKEYLEYSMQFVQKVENSFVCSCFKTNPSFIATSASELGRGIGFSSGGNIGGGNTNAAAVNTSTDNYEVSNLFLI